MVIDPAIRKPEMRAFNHTTQLSTLPMTYHLPAIYGFDSFQGETSGIAGIIIFGSASSVHDRSAWQLELERYIRTHIERKCPILGICYGHQMLAYMFGGKVTYQNPKHEKLVGFRKVELLADKLWGGKRLEGELTVSHNEIVSECPAEMKIVGKSEQVAIEAIAHRKLPIWGFQPHPESVSGQFLPASTKPERMAFGHSLVKKFCAYAKEHGT